MCIDYIQRLHGQRIFRPRKAGETLLSSLPWADIAGFLKSSIAVIIHEEEHILGRCRTIGIGYHQGLPAPFADDSTGKQLNVRIVMDGNAGVFNIFFRVADRSAPVME